MKIILQLANLTILAMDTDDNNKECQKKFIRSVYIGHLLGAVVK
jgi:hypothetical protein